MKKSTWIPIVLLIYLAVMSCIGYRGYASGQTSAGYYFGIIGTTLLVIILLHFHLRKREKLRREREEDLKRSNK